jgi:uncharacterized membrane-anchored protein
MKLFVKEEDRRPDPAPVKSNVGVIALAGVLMWSVVLAVFLVFPATLPAEKPWWLFTCIVGIVLGLAFYLKFGRGT